MVEPAVDVEKIARELSEGSRRALARAITLIESQRPDHAAAAGALLDAVLPRTGGALRVGVTGTPGVGKSTLIEALGLHLTSAGKNVAVLAVDPSSPVSGGSILGDKTRMERLGREPHAFIRPSPTGGELGGVARRTRETLLLCEAAGFDVVLVETVGVGQSEVKVASMVDTFLLLLQPGAGDELQGVKRGVLELSDVLVVNKADGDLEKRAKEARSEYRKGLSLLRPPLPGWQVPVLLASALNETGIDALADALRAHRAALDDAGALLPRRREQAAGWFDGQIDEALHARLMRDARTQARVGALRDDVEAGRRSGRAAALDAVEALFSSAPGAGGMDDG